MWRIAFKTEEGKYESAMVDAPTIEVALEKFNNAGVGEAFNIMQEETIVIN